MNAVSFWPSLRFVSVLLSSNPPMLASSPLSPPAPTPCFVQASRAVHHQLCLRCSRHLCSLGHCETSNSIESDSVATWRTVAPPPGTSPRRSRASCCSNVNVSWNRWGSAMQKHKSSFRKPPLHTRLQTNMHSLVVLPQRQQEVSHDAVQSDGTVVVTAKQIPSGFQGKEGEDSLTKLPSAILSSRSNYRPND